MTFESRISACLSYSLCRRTKSVLGTAVPSRQGYINIAEIVFLSLISFSKRKF